MGSAPDGTMCVYCDQEEAGYIPDGLLGFTCGTCMDECSDFGIEFLDRKRMTRFLRSLRAVTGGQRGEGRRNPFYHLFLEEDAQLGYGIAPFLIWTTPTPRAAVAAPELPASSWSSVTEGSDDDGNDRWSLLWEHQWQVVMEAELGSPAEVPTWTLDRVLPEWHTTAYRGLRTAHGLTELVQATHEIMRARYETLQAEQSLREAERTVLIAQHNLRAAQRNRVLAVAQERQYDTGIRNSTTDGWDAFQRWHQPRWRLPERYESAWAILAWLTTHGPVGNLPARNELAALYYASLSQWDRFQTHRPREGEEQRWPTPRWQHYLQDVGPLEQHYLRDVYQHYLQDQRLADPVD